MYPYPQFIFNRAVEPSIAEGVHINGIITCEDKVTIEKDVFTGHGVMILSGGHDYFKFGPERKEAGTHAPITIREGVWICSGAIILAGVEIGKHAVVAAGAVVTHNVPEYSVVAGVPARVIKEISH